jgi:hypothetical protein
MRRCGSAACPASRDGLCTSLTAAAGCVAWLQVGGAAVFVRDGAALPRVYALPCLVAFLLLARQPRLSQTSLALCLHVGNVVLRVLMLLVSAGAGWGGPLLRHVWRQPAAGPQGRPCCCFVPGQPRRSHTRPGQPRRSHTRPARSTPGTCACRETIMRAACPCAQTGAWHGWQQGR